MRPSTHGNQKIIQNLIKLLVIIAAIILVIFIIVNKSDSNTTNSGSNSKSSTSTTSATPANAYAILSPATVAPKVAECDQSVSYSSSGVPSPLQCSNGYLNADAWSALSAQEPKVMSLGYSPNASQIQSAVCSDVTAAASDSAPGADNSIETAVFQISALYYGWDSAGNISSYISSCSK